MSSEVIGELGQVGLKIENTASIKLTKPNESFTGNYKKKARLASSHRPKKFRQAWMMFDIFKDWLRPHTSPEFATCIVCNRVIKAGKSELEKHAAGKRHQMLRGTSGTTAVLIGQELITSELPVSISINGDGSTVNTDGSQPATAPDEYAGVTCMETAGFSSNFSLDATQSEGGNHENSFQQPAHQKSHQFTQQLSQQSSNRSISQQILQAVNLPQLVPYNAPKATVGKAAPHWRTTAVVNGHVTILDLSDYRGRYLVLFFYPHDFNRLCANEVNSLSDRIGEFRSSQTEIVACSVDSHHCHLAWSKLPRAEGGVANPRIPLLADPTHSIASDYGVLIPDLGHTLRGTFLIDRKGVLRVMSIYDKLVGRGLDELLRSVQALHFSDETEEAVPPDWSPPNSEPLKCTKRWWNGYHPEGKRISQSSIFSYYRHILDHHPGETTIFEHFMFMSIIFLFFLKSLLFI